MLVAVVLLGGMASSALGITRDQVLARAQTWIDHPVPYSQAKYYANYRTDCSGYVSMCWNATSGGSAFSWSTATMHAVAYPITAGQLKPGDVMLWAGHHVRLFVGWVDSSHTRYVAYEQTPPQTKSDVKVFADDLSDGYLPYRYNGITDSIPSWNLYSNDTFDIWSDGLPMWCAFTGTGTGTKYSQATDVPHSSCFALRLVNPGTTATSTADMKQTVPVTPGYLYGLSVWARGPAAPGAAQMHLQFLDASGHAVAGGCGVDGTSAGVNATTFKRLMLSATAPPTATQAIVYLRLTGGTSSAGPAGGQVVFDDVALWVASPLPVYRFYNKNGSHFYTASGTERDSVIESLSSTLKYEGVCYAVRVTSPSNDHPLYRFYNKKNGTHFYTASAAEKASIIAHLSGTYRLDGPAYNVCVTPVAGATPVYRFYNKKNGTHFYTASEAEKANTLAKFASTYTLDGVAFYLAP